MTAMASHKFLSPEWVEAVTEIRQRHASRSEHYPRAVINHTITDVPSLDGGTADFHTDIRSPHFFERGHAAEGAELTIRTSYETARGLYRDGSWNLQRLRDAYADGSLEVDGDLELIPEWWQEVVTHPAEMMMYDEIMMVTD